MSTDTLIADRLEIADLFTRLAHLFDERRWEDAGTVYTDDVEIQSPRIQTVGLDKVIDYLRGSEVDGERTQHVTTDLLVNVDGDQATAAANSVVYFCRDGQPPHQTSGLRLTCTAIRTSAGWRLDKSRITSIWQRKD